jgi:hypothetical protein
MYKILFTTSLLFTIFTSKAQDLPVNAKSGKITFMKTIDAKGLNSQELYDIAKKWGETNNLTITEDQAGSKIVYKGACNIEYPTARTAEKSKGNVTYKFQFGAKEGKYRYIFTDFTHTGEPEDAGALEDAEPDCGLNKITIRGWTLIKKTTGLEILKLIKSLTKKIKAEQNDPTKNEDW